MPDLWCCIVEHNEVEQTMLQIEQIQAQLCDSSWPVLGGCDIVNRVELLVADGNHHFGFTICLCILLARWSLVMNLQLFMGLFTSCNALMLDSLLEIDEIDEHA